jgi:hypothetical protein
MNALKRKVDDSGRKLHEEIHADIGKLEAKLIADSQQHQQETQALKRQLKEVLTSLRILHSKIGVSGSDAGGSSRQPTASAGDEDSSDTDFEGQLNDSSAGDTDS